MKPIEFEGANIIIGEKQPEYLPLPAKLEKDGTVTTVWELTPEEREEISKTGKLYLRQLTFNRPLQPLCPSVVPFEQEGGNNG